MNDISGKTLSSVCQSDADYHCLTCADESVPVKVVRIDQEAGLAFCSAVIGRETNRHKALSLRSPGADFTDQVEEIDITLVEDVAVGDILLAHAGVAIAHYKGADI